MRYMKSLVYLSIVIGFSSAIAGSYEDFFAAVKKDDATEVQQLLARGFDANTPDEKGLQGLMLAIQEPSPKVAKALIAWPKTNVEARNKNDESPLMIASLQGKDDLAAALIARGADVNKPGWTPLHYAATKGHLNVMKRLLEESAYIDAESPNGTTPLMMAAFYGTPEAVQLLLDEGADPSIKNKLGMTAFDFATKANRSDAAERITAAARAKQPRGKW